MLNRKTLGIAAATAMIAPAAVLGLSAASASAATMPSPPIILAKCSTSTVGGNVTTCMDWHNSGRHISFIDATATVHHESRTLEVCIFGPHGLLKCNPHGFVRVKPGEHITADWRPNARESAGVYTVETFQLNSSHRPSRIDVIREHIG